MGGFGINISYILPITKKKRILDTRYVYKNILWTFQTFQIYVSYFKFMFPSTGNDHGPWSLSYGSMLNNTVSSLLCAHVHINTNAVIQVTLLSHSVSSALVWPAWAMLLVSVLCCLQTTWGRSLCIKHLRNNLKCVLCCRYLIQVPENIKNSHLCHSVFYIKQGYFIFKCECGLIFG